MDLLEQGTTVSILQVEGTLRVPVSSDLRQRVEAMLRRGKRRIVVDLSRLSAIDAAGVGELVGTFNAAREAGGVLQVAHASRRVRHLLHITGVLTFLAAGAEG